MRCEGSELRGYLKDEYLLLQNQYEDFDRRSLTIKGWVGSGSAAALGLAFNSSYSEFSFVVPIFVAIIAAVFWFLETYWKIFQYALSGRIQVIEAYFREDPDVLIRDPPPFQIYRSWFQTYYDKQAFADEKRPPQSWRKRLWTAARQPFVSALYVTIIALSVMSSAVLLYAKAVRHPQPPSPVVVQPCCVANSKCTP